MKKLFVTVLAVCFLAGMAQAAEVEISGDYYVRGQYVSNPSQVSTDPDPEPFGLYDHELDMTAKIVVDDNTFISINAEMRDEIWTQSATHGVEIDPTATTTQTIEYDDNIEIRKLWAGHTFSTGTKLELGRMSGGSWATDFGNTADDFYRIKVTQPIPMGSLIFIVQKNVENGNDVEDSEASDSDTYYVAGVFKVGEINVKPLIAYKIDGTLDDPAAPAAYGDDTDTTTSIHLGIDGVFGMIGFESEFIYTSANRDSGEDYTIWGAYGDVYAKLDPAKVGAFIAYGSVDDDAGVAFAFGDDFDGHGSLLLGDLTSFGKADQIAGAMLAGIYGEFNATEDLSFTAQLAYAKANEDLDKVTAAVGASKDDTATDISVIGKYKITDAVTYEVGGGYITIDRDSGDDPDPGYRLYHKFEISF